MPQFAQPTEAQKQAGNYLKWHIRVAGLPITIENRKGSIRSGKPPDGTAWSVLMPAHYGYVNRTVGADGDQVDVFVGPNRNSELVVIVNQHHAIGGQFDEVKALLGFDSLAQAKSAYRSAYRGKLLPRPVFKITTIDRFKEWLKTGRTWTAFQLASRISTVDLASALRSRSSVDTTTYAGSANHDLKVGGVWAGHLRTEGNSVTDSYISPKFRGLGLGKKLYGEAIKRTPGGLVSDVSVSAEAQRVWDSIARRSGSYASRSVAGPFGPRSAAKLTAFESAMKRLIQFRLPTDDEKSSVAGKVAAVAAPAAVIAGTLAYKHYTRPAKPTPAVNPANPPARLRAEVRQPVIGDVGDPRTTEWLTKGEQSGLAPRPKPSLFYRKPAAVSAASVTAGVVKFPGASKAARVAGAVGAKESRLAKIAAAAKKLPTSGRKLSLGAARVFNLVQFNDPNAAFGNVFGASDRIATAYRTGRRIVPWVRRGGQVATDTANIASGKKVDKPFYTKAWFKAGALGAAIGAPILAARKINAWHQQDKAFPNSVSAMSPKLGRAKEQVLKVARQADAKWVASKPGRVPLLTHDTDPFFAAKIKKPILLRAVLEHLRNFDYGDPNGWDIRDARGKSARVFSPDSKQRTRRPKTWDERTDTIRAERNVAAGAAVAGTIGTLIYANRAKVADAAAQVAAKTGRDRVVKGIKSGLARGRIKIFPPANVPHPPGVIPLLKEASARVLAVNFAGKSALSNLVDATKRNVSLPTPEIPGQGAVTYVSQLPPKRRAGVLRVLGAGALIGGGTLAGVAVRRPKTGAALGGLTAGLLLRS